MTQKQKVLNRVRELVPETVRLNEGCRVFIQNFVVSITILEDRRGYAHIPESREPNADFIGWTGHNIQPFNIGHIVSVIGFPLFAHHLLEVVRRTYTGTSMTISDEGYLDVYVPKGGEKAFNIPLLSPIEDWDKDMTPEEAERMWELLGRALGI